VKKSRRNRESIDSPETTCILYTSIVMADETYSEQEEANAANKGTIAKRETM
jgi:hypothetical protein